MNFTVGAFDYSQKHIRYVSTTLFYYVTPMVFIIPPGLPENPIEKLMKPFSNKIWTCLSLSFLLTALIVAIGKFITRKRRVFLFGHQNQHPFINTVNLFFGGAMPTLPRRNFARFSLMLWIILSLVVRIYKSVN